MTLVPKEYLPLIDVVREAPALKSGDIKRATVYYQEMMRTLMESGYKLERGGATLSSIHYVSRTRQNMPDRLQKYIPFLMKSIDDYGSHPERPEFLPLQNYLQQRYVEMDERFYTLPLSEPGNPLSTAMFHYGSNLYIDSTYYKGEKTVNADSIVVYLGTTPENDGKLVYYLQDWLSGCSYESEKYNLPDTQGPDPANLAEALVSMLLSSVKMYVETVSIADIEGMLLEEISSWDVEKLQLYVHPKYWRGSGDFGKLLKSFSQVVVTSYPEGRDVDTVYTIGINRDVNIFSPIKDSARPNQIVLDDSIMRQGGHRPFHVNGTIPLFILESRNDAELKFVRKESTLKQLPDETHFGEDLEVYEYYDKYNNLVTVFVKDPWYNVFNQGRIRRVFVQPSAEAPKMLGVDLAPVGMRDYSSLFEIAVLPVIATINDTATVYSDVFRPSDLTENIRGNIKKGINLAEEMFKLFGFVMTIEIRGANMPNAYAARSHSGVIFIHGKGMLLEMGQELGWLVPFHEAMHLLDNNFGLSNCDLFARQFKRFPNIKEADKCATTAECYFAEDATPHPFIAAIKEENWYGGRCWYGHPWGNRREFFASLMATIMHPDIKKGYNSLAPELQTHYIESLEVLSETIKIKIPHGSRLPIYRKIINTIDYLTRP